MDHGLTRIGVITDVHANLYALQAALAALDAYRCDVIIHTGDAIGIGPHPLEVMEVLRSRSDVVCLMGNHDELFAFDRLQNPPTWLAPGELAHQRWTHAQLPDEWRASVASWPYTLDLAINDTMLRFQHYGRGGDGFSQISRDNLAAELDAVFQPTADIVFYGHHHPRSDVQGKARYINPGALGTNPGEGARYAVVERDGPSGVSIALHAVPYDAAVVRADLMAREVPETAFILKVFLA